MRDFKNDLEAVKNFCTQHKIGFGGMDKEDDDESRYTIAYEMDNATIFLYLTEDETDETDQVILDTIIVKIYHDMDILSILYDKCKAHGIILEIDRFGR
jgi:hypothetical protein